MSQLTPSPGHIGIPVKDMEKSCDFYTKLGFSKAEHHNLPHKTKVNFMKLSSVSIEHYKLADTLTSNKAGAIDHFAIHVASLSDIMKDLNKHGIHLVDGPTKLPFGSNGVTYIIIEGPDKERIEFDEYH